MTEKDAGDILDMIVEQWQMFMGGATKQLWISFLVGQDAELATKAVARLAKTMRKQPRIADLSEVIVMLERERRSPEPTTAIDPGKRGVEAPEWVWVWSWARFQRAPRNYRAFPQQAPHADPTDMLSQEEYEKLRDEWIAAGSPKAETPIPAALTR